MVPRPPPAGRALGRPAFVFALGALGAAACAGAAAPMSSSDILQELRSFRETGSVLYLAAHPDDENTRLIACLARGRGYRTGYLSITRGDGGQNLIGPELGEALGVIRTQELLAARRIDGGEQFFTRAIDFGFSKNPEETLAIWDRQAVLADVVRVIRTFRPDVIVTRFPPVPSGTHGHHTASAMLAMEAFKLAGDPAALREELGDLPPWQPKRLLWNSYRWGNPPPVPGVGAPLRLDVGGYNPLLGESYGEIAARSRSMHKSQGFGSVGSRGAAFEEFQVLAGEPATQDLMDGVDTSWARFAGGADIGRLADAAIARFAPLDPAASVSALLEIRRQLDALAPDPLVAAKRRQLDDILAACLGLRVETIIPAAEVVPGETLALKHTVILRSPRAVRWTAVRYPADGDELAVGTVLPDNEPQSRDAARQLPANAPPSQPYWLRAEHPTGTFRVDDPDLIGRPENPPAFPVRFVFEIEGQELVVNDAPVQVIDDPVKGELRHPLEVIPPVTLAFADDLALFAPGAKRTVSVDVVAARPDCAGVLRLEPAGGWQVSPAEQRFRLAAAGSRQRFDFEITAPARPGTAAIVASAEVGGVRYRAGRTEIHYEHIVPQMLQPVARLRAVSLELATRGRSVGYLPGAGDLVAECIARLGCAVTTLAAADLTPERLHGFDAVVIGIRAFNTRTDLAPRLPALFAYAEAGGTVIVQYNTANELQTLELAPFPLTLSRDRVTDETAPVTLLAPDHPALTTPNRIGPADFDGWVQERGLYFPSEWDARFTPLLACADPGETQKTGALLVARHGRGWFVYTGLSFFRELPEGVPGAYRLFANLLSLGR